MCWKGIAKEAATVYRKRAQAELNRADEKLLNKL